MTVPLDSSACLAAGYAFALAGSEAMENDPAAESACLNRGRLFTALVAAPLSLFFLFRWPDWSWMYLLRRGTRSRLLGALVFCLDMVLHEVGFRDAARLVKEGRRDRAVLHTAAAASLPGLISLVGIRRLMRLGTLEEYESGEARFTLFSLSWLLSLTVAGAVAAVGAISVLVKNVSQGGSR